jgi:hypothetical protein
MLNRWFIYTLVCVNACCFSKLSWASGDDLGQPQPTLTYAEICAGKGLTTRAFMAEGFSPVALNDISLTSLDICIDNITTVSYADLDSELDCEDREVHLAQTSWPSNNKVDSVLGDITDEDICRLFIVRARRNLENRPLDLFFVFLHERNFLGIMKASAKITKALKPKMVIFQTLGLNVYTKSLNNRTAGEEIYPLREGCRYRENRSGKYANLDSQFFITAFNDFMTENPNGGSPVYAGYKTTINGDDAHSPIMCEMNYTIFTIPEVVLPERFLKAANARFKPIKTVLEEATHYIREVTGKQDWPADWWSQSYPDGTLHPYHKVIQPIDPKFRHVLDSYPLVEDADNATVTIYSPAVTEIHKRCGEDCEVVRKQNGNKSLYHAGEFTRPHVNGHITRPTYLFLFPSTFVHPTQARGYTPLEVFCLYGLYKLGPCAIEEQYPNTRGQQSRAMRARMEERMKSLMQITPAWFSLHVAKEACKVLSEVKQLPAMPTFDRYSLLIDELPPFGYEFPFPTGERIKKTRRKARQSEAVMAPSFTYVNNYNAKRELESEHDESDASDSGKRTKSNSEVDDED